MGQTGIEGAAYHLDPAQVDAFRRDGFVTLPRFLTEAGLPDARVDAAVPTLEDVFVALLRGERLEGEA